MVAAVNGPSIPLAFLAGLVSFLSPCVFPLMPAYAAYLSGRAGNPALAMASGGSVETGGRSSVMTSGFAFVAGFSLVFIAEYYLLEGVLAVTVFQRNLELVNRLAGAVIMVLALQTMGVLRFGWLMRERRIHLRNDERCLRRPAAGPHLRRRMAAVLGTAARRDPHPRAEP